MALKRRLIIFLGIFSAVFLGFLLAWFKGPLSLLAQSPASGTGLGVTISMSTPYNGAYFVPGEQAEVKVTLKDKSGGPLSRNDFATLNLYGYGPQETTKTVTAVKLLNATSDRSKTPHHFINLLTNYDVQDEGSLLRYALQPVSDEAAGTYTLTVWAVRKGTPAVDQTFALFDFQLGTATVEKQIVEKENCARCHQGASNGQFYLHHTDPTATNSYGNPAIDSVPVRTCKSCHNNEGYAGYAGNIANPTGPTTVRTPDPIVRRVHGVHMGEELKNTFNTDPKTGNFKVYTEVTFPADVRNCTKCHVDDRWKTQPSRQACGACHDAIWFGETAAMPATFKAHPGGPQANDQACALCHPADTGGVMPVAVAHKVDRSAPFTVTLAMSPPANGKFYAAGDKPTITMTFNDTASGAVVDPAAITEAVWNRVSLQVSGPRYRTAPVLTMAAAKPSPTSSYIYNDLRVRTNPADEDSKLSRSATAMTYQLSDVAGLTTGTYTIFAQARKVAGSIAGVALINFQVGTETVEKQVATNCADCHGDTNMHGSYPLALAPDLCKNCHDYQNQMPGKTAWTQNNWGFGAAPISRRVHGVHFGRYLDKPLEVYANPASFDASKIIFPQDVRNCEKCHDPKTTSGTWKTEPSRLACMGCHDRSVADAHARVMTIYPDPANQWSSDKVETCAVCHGAGRDFSPDKVHNISNPYKPPYPRERE